MAFGTLVYSSVEYFTFICMIESVFVKCLPYDHLVVHGSMLILKNYNLLINDSNVIESINTFLPDNISVNILRKALDFIIHIYSRMRGDDFCFKLLSTGLALKLTMRQAMSIVSNLRFNSVIKEKKSQKK